MKKLAPQNWWFLIGFVAFTSTLVYSVVWNQSLADTFFVVQNTYHTILHPMPVKLVFLSYMILQTPFSCEWGAIRRHKQELIYINYQD